MCIKRHLQQGALSAFSEITLARPLILRRSTAETPSPTRNRPPHADNLCEKRTPWAPISKMRIIEGRCEFRLQVRKRTNIETESRDFFDWQCLIPFLKHIHNYSMVYPRAGARYPQALKNWLEIWKECQNDGGIRAPPPDWDKITHAAPATPIPPPNPNPPPVGRKRGRAKATLQTTPGWTCAIGTCTRSFETGEELWRHEAGHGLNRILEEAAAIRQELRLERLERAIKEQETSRLLNEVLSCLKESPQIETQTRRPRDQDLASEIAPHRTDTGIESAENVATRRVTNMDDPPANTTQPPAAIRMCPPNEPRLAERSEEPDGTGGGWLIPNHRKNRMPVEFICQWVPCDTTFDTYSGLIQHIRTHQILFQCRWNGCNDMVPVSAALGHLTRETSGPSRQNLQMEQLPTTGIRREETKWPSQQVYETTTPSFQVPLEGLQQGHKAV